jgi:hypothetical protein
MNNATIDFIAETTKIAVVGYVGNEATSGENPVVFALSLTEVTDGASVTVTSATPSITAISGVRYNCTASAVTELSFTPSASGLCSVRFKSGSTATVLTLPNTVRMPTWWAGCAANTTYEISVEDGVYGVVAQWA